MTDSVLAHLMLTAAVLIAVARAAGWAFARIGQPPVIGEIVGGLLVGPTVLGAVAPGVQRALLPSLSGPHRADLALLAALGLTVLMFSTGNRALDTLAGRDVRSITSIALVGMLVPFGLGLVLVQGIDLDAAMGPAGSRVALVIVIATAIAITSVPVIARILNDLGLGTTRFARIVLVVGVVEDLALYAVLGMAISLVGVVHAPGLTSALGIRAGSAGAVAVYAMVTCGLVAGSALLARRGAWSRAFGHLSVRDELSALVVTIGLGVAIGSYLGVNAALAALIVGHATAAPASHRTRRNAVEAMELVGFSALVPLYFVSVGAQLDLRADLDVMLVVELLVAACVLKVSSVYLGARLGGESRRTARSLAVALNARGGQGIVVANLALAAGIISRSAFTALVLIALATSAFAGAWLRRHRAAVETASKPAGERLDAAQPSWAS